MNARVDLISSPSPEEVARAGTRRKPQDDRCPPAGVSRHGLAKMMKRLGLADASI
jgi:hypothetical protein